MSKTEQMIWTSSKLRESFINFFKSKDHPIIPSSCVIPEDDPTLLFTNSGMVQFKSRFLNESSKFSDLKRACSIQHCIRAGGKHNDLEDVGHDTYHHTFFEMMGNWSFGDYGKETAIKYAWEYLTDVLGLEKERLYATYFCPNSAYPNIPEDVETREIWLKYLPENRVLPFAKENFWEMGNIGPCGPCTEIHYDMSGQKLRSDKVNRDDPSLIEIWNLVFMQYYRNKDCSLKNLDTLSVDTGMGFERLLGILNRVSNYETDLFLPLFNLTNLNYVPDKLFCETDQNTNLIQNTHFNEDLTRSLQNIDLNKNMTDLVQSAHSDGDMTDSTKKANLNKNMTKSVSNAHSDGDVSDSVENSNMNTLTKKEIRTKSSEKVELIQKSVLSDNVALRIISDHARTISVCLFNNLKFSPDGPGYVLRRITRRMIRISDEKNVQNLREIVEEAGRILNLDIKEEMLDLFDKECTQFKKTLRKGVKYFNSLVKVTPEEIFKLKDTYGFPIDLTEQMCREKNIKFDKKKVDLLIEKAIEKSKQRKRT